MKGYALRLALKKRHKITRKWPISLVQALQIDPEGGTPFYMLHRYVRRQRE